MDVEGKFFLIEKHWRAKNIKGKRRRSFFIGNDEIEKAVERAKKYSQNNREDYLLVQVVKEITKPKG